MFPLTDGEEDPVLGPRGNNKNVVNRKWHEVTAVVEEDNGKSPHVLGRVTRAIGGHSNTKFARTSRTDVDEEVDVAHDVIVSHGVEATVVGARRKIGGGGGTSGGGGNGGDAESGEERGKQRNGARRRWR